MESSGLALPHHLHSITVYKQGLEPMEEACFCQCCALLLGLDYVPAASERHRSTLKLLFSPSRPPRALSLSLNHSTYPISVFLMHFSLSLFILQPPTLSHSTRASVEVLSRVCRQIQRDRRVKRVSCSPAAAEAPLLRGCDLDNQEELERLQALEPLQLQQCQEGVSCVTQRPI